MNGYISGVIMMPLILFILLLALSYPRLPCFAVADWRLCIVVSLADELRTRGS